MSIKAFVLIETSVGKTKEVIAALQKVEGIKSVDAVTGPYDIIAVVEQDDLNAVGKLVTTQIHPISGVNRTVSCLSIRVT
jgi:DNA-binding Lrp family transcriptional regulator